jgi:Holliday junction resolvase RusA-like endonuclease
MATYWTPTLPDMMLSANGRVNLHRFQRSKLVGEDRERWGWAWKSIRVQRPESPTDSGPFSLKIIVAFPDKRNRDTDGVLSAMKTAIDALVDVGVLPDDKGVTLPNLSIEIEFRSRKPGTTIELEKL